MLQMHRKLMVATVIGIGVLGMVGPSHVSFMSEAQAFGLGDLNPVKAAKKAGGAIKKGVKTVGKAAKGTAKAKGTITDRLKQAGGAIKKGAKKVGSAVKAVADVEAAGTGVIAAVGAWGVGQVVRGAGKVLDSETLEKAGKGLANVCGFTDADGGSEKCLKRLGYGLQTGGMTESARLQAKAAKGAYKFGKCVAKGGCGKIGDPPAPAQIGNLGAARKKMLTKAVTAKAVARAAKATAPKQAKLKVRTDQIRCIRAPCNLGGTGDRDGKSKTKTKKLKVRTDQIRCVRAPCKIGGNDNRRGRSKIRDHRRKTLTDRNDRRRQVKTHRTRRQVEDRRSRRRVDRRNTRRDYRTDRSRRKFESHRSRRQFGSQRSSRQFGGHRSRRQFGRRR